LIALVSVPICVPVPVNGSMVNTPTRCLPLALAGETCTKGLLETVVQVPPQVSTTEESPACAAH
jgi:hypothetical protein